MSRRYEIFQVDAFTKDRFSGNPAGVVLAADGLTVVEMQRIARELNNSETAFVFESDSSAESNGQCGYDVHVRFFTPTKEVPICGHATISAHYVRAVGQRSDTARVLQKTGAGILPVDIIKTEDDYRIVMTQGKIEYGDIIIGEHRQQLLDALRLNEEDVLTDRPIQIVSTGHSKVLIGIRSIEMLHGLEPDHQSLERLSDKIGCNGYHVHVMDDGSNNGLSDGVLVHGRMFAPAIGIQEDPVTGNANGPLGAYLVHHCLVDVVGDVFTFKAKQGEAMGRPGTIEVEVGLQAGEPTEVRVSGNAVIVFRTEIELP